MTPQDAKQLYEADVMTPELWAEAALAAMDSVTTSYNNTTDMFWREFFKEVKGYG
jgi:hypothetical protein